MDGTPVTYVAWAPNEPSFANNDENCVVMLSEHGKWQFKTIRFYLSVLGL